MDEKPESIEARAVTAVSNGEYAKALAIRERLLLALQKRHGDPCEETDNQKIKICDLICLLATHEQQSNVNSLVQHSMENHRRQASFVAEYGEAPMQSDHPNRKAQVERESLEAVHRSSSYLQSRAAMQSDGVVTKSLSLQGLLAFGERLIAKNNTLPESQAKKELRQVRSNLLMLLATVLYREGRPRAALPLAQTAQAELIRLAPLPDRASLDVTSGYLTLASVLSASNKHKEALQCAHRALQTALTLEERFAENDPTLSSASRPIYDEKDSLALPNPNHDDADERAARRIEPGSYLGSLLAACYHNIGAEQEHLSLPELALRTYSLGFRMAKRAHGDAHPLVEKMYANYCSVFKTVNFKHFYPDGHRPGEPSTALEDAARAVRRLNFSYLSSHRHEVACQREAKLQANLLATTPDAHSDTTMHSRTQKIVCGKIRPGRDGSRRLVPASYHHQLHQDEGMPGLRSRGSSGRLDTSSSLRPSTASSIRPVD